MRPLETKVRRSYATSHSIRAMNLLSIVVLIGACSFGPQEDPTRFYMLGGEEDAASYTDAVIDSARVNVGIGPFAIPGYLDRAQFVRRVGPNEVDPVEAARWAESLEEGFERVLAASLDARAPGVTVYSHPWRATTLTQWIITGSIHRFETDASGDAVLDITWRVLDPHRKPTNLGARSVVRASSAGPRIEDEVAALSEAVDQLAALLAEVLQREGPKLLEGR
ncbi:MAG: PqiC family protein [marine benthic group bacterium]|nr:PqiC family protein [Gemmatimonadota bacterium]MCL7963574.1 PqiC family protein [Candidatus Carthagonibacter metallireducens]MCL7938131.1 PqiC family protein [Gemmatimonadota bacterium]MCL7957360.1 PqiC family protein [Gemmatimonadota bacterium]MCL7966355.1 PqiC family protein [Gemmatimonadota bacterium]